MVYLLILLLSVWVCGIEAEYGWIILCLLVSILIGFDFLKCMTFISELDLIMLLSNMFSSLTNLGVFCGCIGCWKSSSTT